MTPAQLEDRLDRLERRLDPQPDPRRREAAVAELTRLVNGVVDSLARGAPPRCEVAHVGQAEAPETMVLLASVWYCRWQAAVATIEAGAEVRGAAALPRGQARNSWGSP